jgi:putative transposase
LQDGIDPLAERELARSADKRARVATARRDTFARTYRQRHPKAVERLARDWERMIAYYAFPQAHWTHLRTTNIIESPFAAVRLRTSAAKRFKKVENATTLIWKTFLVVEHHFRKLNAPHLCTAVYDGVVFHDGVRPMIPTRKLRAA